MSNENTPAHILAALVFATVIGTGLKLANIITWGWPLVTLPIWGPVGTVIVLWIIATVLNKVFKFNQEQAVPLSVVR